MADFFEFILNGRPVRVEDTSPNTTLLEFLRSISFTGTKEGCAEGDCGACSIVVIERDADGNAAYRTVNSCLMPICLLAGREVVSVEGVAFSAPKQNEGGCSANLHPVQRKMVEHFGSQCGYCTPGFIMSITALLEKNPHPTLEEAKHACAGNLCRCGTQPHILQAVFEAAGIEVTNKTEVINHA